MSSVTFPIGPTARRLAGVDEHGADRSRQDLGGKNHEPPRGRHCRHFRRGLGIRKMHVEHLCA